MGFAFESEVELQYTTKNFELLKSDLKAVNLRKTLLEAAANNNYGVFAKAIKRFAAAGQLKDIDAAYEVIDAQGDKQEAFYGLISLLGEHGFFAKGSPAELKAESEQPQIDIAALIDRIAPEAAMESLKNIMTAGQNISGNSEPSVIKPE